MGLDFTHIKDQPGAAIYLIYGDSAAQNKLQRLAETIRKTTTKQIIILDANESNGRDVLAFYAIPAKSVVLIVRDDDQLFQHWTEQEFPNGDQIAYTANQIG